MKKTKMIMKKKMMTRTKNKHDVQVNQLPFEFRSTKNQKGNEFKEDLESHTKKCNRL